MLIAYCVCVCGACQRMVNYPDSKAPVYISHQERDQKAIEKFEVVSFNIAHANNIKVAIKELKTNPDFSTPEILLLQEMDHKGVQQIAEVFGLNYLYFPSVFDKKEFGNAILSKYEITSARKTILPAIQKNNRLRNATNAVLKINGEKVLVYSIHNSTITMPLKKRKAQVDAILSSIPKDAERIIVAGDFNTLGKKYKNYVYQSFEAAGFINATTQIEYTSKYFWNIAKIKNDHIFIKNLNPLRALLFEESTSSDHLPIYLEFDFDK